MLRLFAGVVVARVAVGAVVVGGCDVALRAVEVAHEHVGDGAVMMVVVVCVDCVWCVECCFGSCVCALYDVWCASCVWCAVVWFVCVVVVCRLRCCVCCALLCVALLC